MMWPSVLNSVFFLVCLWSCVDSSLASDVDVSSSSSSYKNLTSQQFYQGIQEAKWDIVIDVRTQDEWNEGHIENATFLESLQLFGTPNQIATPDDIRGCRDDACMIVVYCRSGNRAIGASRVLLEAGFHPPIYNGLGVRQWTEAGYPLVTTPESTDAACMANNNSSSSDAVNVCQAEVQVNTNTNTTETTDNDTPTMSPTETSVGLVVRLPFSSVLLAAILLATTCLCF